MKIKQSELDAAIAVEVMEWYHGAVSIDWYSAGDEETGYIHEANDYHTNLFTPSTDLNHAREALEKFGVITRVVWVPQGLYSVSLGGWDDEIESEHESPAIAICLALLSAFRGEQVTLEDES